MSIQASLSNEYTLRHPARSARVIESLPVDEQAEELAGLEPRALVALFDHLPPFRAGRAFLALDAAQQNEVLNLASPRIAVLLLSQFDEATREGVLGSIDPALRSDIEYQLAFPENSAGRLMDGAFTACRVTMTVGEAIRELRASGIRRARTLFVVDEDSRLTGRVDVQDLAMEDSETPIRRIMHPVDAVLSPMDQREEIVRMLDQHRLDVLPVANTDGKLMGVVRYVSLFSAIEAVATAGLQKMVGNAEERALSTPGFAVRKRLPWLHINLLTAFLAAAVVGLFENIIAQFTALAILLPVVAGQSGNAGSQALAVTMRGLALREIGLREWRKVLNKEVVVGLVDGSVLAVTCGLGVLVWSGSIGLAVVIGVAMILSMLAAGISGAVVPIALTRMGQDPATASSIILTTVTDVAGFFSFLGTATLLSFLL